MTIKGNKFLFNVGNYLTNKFGDLNISAIKAKFPMNNLLVVQFKVNNKFYFITQTGNYKDHFIQYKKENKTSIDENLLFDIIKQNKNKWQKMEVN
jgi:hypothetical protein